MKWSVDQLRSTYLDFFKSKHHTVVKSDSLVPQGDPTLLFTGAGMNQFKDYFLGLKKDLKRATSSQKCLRTADLDRVGQTPYHHSFFEMLGNFSFGDYFKEEAIAWGWEFMTKALQVDPKRLWVSVYEKDDEAYNIWKNKIGLSDSVIKRMGPEDNFWPANAPKDGPNGPCGPCSEIYFVQADGTSAEVWNLVFTQFDRQDLNKLVDLPSKNIDTGMGLERLACLMQGKKSNFEIDIFEPLVSHVRNQLKKVEAIHKNKIEFYDENVYASIDHVRGATFCIIDGVSPSNEGRGYVVRKLIRQAIWKLWKLGVKEPHIEELVPTISEVMKKAYPEIKEHQKLAMHTLKAEEERFLLTLEEGVRRTEEAIAEVKAKNKNLLAPAVTFRLYDTYGLPFEQIEELVKSEGIIVEKQEFEKLLEQQRLRSRNISKISDAIFSASSLDKKLSSLSKTEFTGYSKMKDEAQVISLFDGEKEVQSLQGPCEGFLITNKTPFYAESGGQVGDQGRVVKNNADIANVIDTSKKHDVFLHHVQVLEGQKLSVNDKIILEVNETLRNQTMKNHTATHLLHAALRQVLGTHVRQAGSLVHPDRLRFDFTHFKALTPEEIKKVEDLVNGQIKAKTQVAKEEKSYDEAKKEGAIAFFGEKYGDRVRTITVSDFSKELCGGTHVNNTADIGQFKIVSESSIASGTRRIEALTGNAVSDWESGQKQKQEKQKQSEQQKKNLEIEEKKKIQELSKKEFIDNLVNQAVKVKNNTILIYKALPGASPEGLKVVIDSVKKLNQSIVSVLGTEQQDGKWRVVVAASGDLLNNPAIDSKKILNEVIGLKLGIKGGGRKDLAEGGGISNLSKFESAKEDAKNYLMKTV